MTKIAITADIQFDLYESLSTLDPETMLTTRFRHQLECFRWIMDQAQERGCEELVVLGDVFNSRTDIDVGVIDRVCREFEQAALVFDPVTILVGNHDAYLKHAALNSLRALSGYATIVEAPVLLPTLPDVAFVPWDDDYEIIAKAIDKLAKLGVNYLFSHFMVEGAVPKGGGMALTDVQAHKFKHVFLGDVHKPMTVPGTKNVHYVGSPMQIDYRDAGEERGFVVLDTETGKWEFVENDVSPRFWIIEDVVDIESIDEGDFVRVKTDDVNVAEEAVAAAKAKTGWVESTFVDLEEEPPRMDVSAKDTQDEVLRRYCAYNEIAQCDDLVELGLDILETVNG